jgi:DNA-directed RNA polymerase specialized sigma24 family protein
MLELLAKQHTTWIKYLRSFGCPEYLCEDFVQDMYIKIYEYLEKYDKDLMYNGDEVNYYFVYVTLYNLYKDSHRKKKLNFIDFLDFQELEIEDLVYFEIDNSKELEAVEKWYNSENKNVYEDLYYKKIFEEVFIEKKSVSELSRESKITYWSLRNAVKIIKKQINDLK